jgi:hypothetical protein
MPQAVEVEGERIRSQLERLRNGTCRHPLGSSLDKQAEHVEPVVLGESGQRRDCIRLFHNSTNMEMMAPCQEDGAIAGKRMIMPFPVREDGTRGEYLAGPQAPAYPNECIRRNRRPAPHFSQGFHKWTIEYP